MKTVLRNTSVTNQEGNRPSTGENPSMTVKYRDNRGIDQVKRFSGTFIIGREDGCDIQLEEDCVSRQHVKVELEAGVWIVRDLGSTNGSFLDNQRINTHCFKSNSRLQLGNEGPVIYLEIESKNTGNNGSQQNSGDLSSADRYIDPNYDGPMGDHTRFVRHAISQTAKKQKKVYLNIIGLVGALLIGALSYATYQQYRLEQLDELTVDIFYNMKEVELQLASLESNGSGAGLVRNREQLSAMRAKLAEMENQYDAYLVKGGHVTASMSEEDKLIQRVARIFGECEVNLPGEFVSEVKKYIAKWKSSSRLEQAIERANINGYTQIVQKVMLEHYLPPQFFYLALQESDYKRNSVGPRTRYGIAKGIWQFIPITANRYGLRTGPLIEEKSYDPKDERFDFDKSTRAAARYIRQIYTTDAQASGLLVMASYNWGEHRIIERIRNMPKNPHERNFWQLLKKDKLPTETYDYVYYIFAAAVIGENPRLFGFDFENPLAQPKDERSKADVMTGRLSIINQVGDREDKIHRISAVY